MRGTALKVITSGVLGSLILMEMLLVDGIEDSLWISVYIAMIVGLVVLEV